MSLHPVFFHNSCTESTTFEASCHFTHRVNWRKRPPALPTANPGVECCCRKGLSVGCFAVLSAFGNNNTVITVSFFKQKPKLKVKTAEFVTSAGRPNQFLTNPIPHFVFAGRSNVGKSSLINALTRKKGLAKTSQTPGKTRLVNYFIINDEFFFVDVPGYGYAQVVVRVGD